MDYFYYLLDYIKLKSVLNFISWFLWLELFINSYRAPKQVFCETTRFSQLHNFALKVENLQMKISHLNIDTESICSGTGNDRTEVTKLIHFLFQREAAKKHFWTSPFKTFFLTIEKN